ncbi:Tyrosine-protein kinase BAZ1B [Acropora cervicornis]|uniref:Tyrosine-protein kinase BAZ1B n=1 Tax=Acropora cervicornis TaxID=6130 RepID=A0AAD9VBS7_ACRCE|nr:Tyrosine-protein kinase BAZ1B [Acropora cervicornis]
MPLLGKNIYKPSPLPKDLEPEEEVFVIKETKEVFRSEYVKRIILYGFQVWSCQLTGKTNLKYAEAVESEKQALESLQSFPKYFQKPVLQIVHHNAEGLHALGQQCYKHLKNEYFKDEPVEYLFDGQWNQGRISKVLRKSVGEIGVEDKDDVCYEIHCERDDKKDFSRGDIKRTMKLPSLEMLKCFIRANTETPWAKENSPWVVKADLVKKHSLVDKFNDFSLKKSTPKSKSPTKRMKSSFKKPEKKLVNDCKGHGKAPSQRKLDAFARITGSSVQTKDKFVTSNSMAESSVKPSLNYAKTHTPDEKGVKKATNLRKDEDITPSGELRGTPVKCRLVLTPVKSPLERSGRSPTQTSMEKRKCSSKAKTAVIVDESPKQKPVKRQSKPGNKKGKVDKLSKLKDTPSSKVPESVVVVEDGSDESNHCITKVGEKSEKGQTMDLVNLNDADEVPETFPKKPIDLKQKVTISKKKQTTLLDLTKKPLEEGNVLTSAKIKAKKQKTLSEMFTSALQKEKPNALNALIRKTAQVVSSPSSLTLNLPTPQRDHVVKKFIAHKERQLNGKLKQKQEDSEMLDLNPLPPGKPVNLPSGITFQTYGDIILIAEFVNVFHDLLAPKETLHVSIDNLSDALVTGAKGFPLLSRILVNFLQILLQDSSTKGEELGLHLSEMPLTKQTAPEVSRLYLSTKLSGLTARAEARQIQGTLECLQNQEFYTLSPDQKIKIMVMLCHEVLASDALDDYVGSQLAEATELRKEKMAKKKEKKDQEREEKERLRKEKEELQRRKEEEESKKQLTMDDLNKKDPADKLNTSGEAVSGPVAIGPSSKVKNNTGEQKATQEKEKGVGSKKTEDESDVVKAIRKRREDMANKEENKMKELQESSKHLGLYLESPGVAVCGCVFPAVGVDLHRLQETMTHCKHTKRLVPIGFDRNDARYWVFNGVAGGVFVEHGLSNQDCFLSSSGDSSEKDDDVLDEASMVFVEGSKDVSPVNFCNNDHVHEPFTRNANKKPARLQADEEGFMNCIKQDLKDTAERLVHGNLAVLSDGLEQYHQAVDSASSVKDLASELEKLLPSVLPQFCQGAFSNDKAKQSWLKEVKKAATTARLHLLLEILDSTVIWDLSAENASCRVCRHKGLGTMLILCDDCNLAYHLQCLRPALSEVPEGHWSCPLCKPSERPNKRTCTKNYKEDSSSAGDTDDQGSEASLDDSEENKSDDESDGHEDYCDECGEDGDLICCDSCPLVFHTACHQPPLRNVPRGAWSCWKCRQPKEKTKKNVQGKLLNKTKEPSKKTEKLSRRDGSPPRKNLRKRSRDVVSKNLHPQKVSKRSRETRNETSRGRRGRKRPFIEDLSDDESIDGKTRNTKRLDGKQTASPKESVLSKLRWRFPRDSSDEEKNSNSNAHSFYGRSTRRTRQQKHPNHENEAGEHDEDGEVAPLKQTRRNTGREYRRIRCDQTVDDSEDDDEENEMDEKENHRASRRAKSSSAKGRETSVRRSTRNQRQVSKSSEESEDDAEDDVSSLDESVDSGPKIPGNGASQRSALSDKLPEANKRSKDQQPKTRNSARHDMQQEGKREKRRRVNAEMVCCEQVLKDLALHEDSWPFLQPVNLREVPDYLELVETPMDLGTIREKLNSWEYSDVESFVADVRLVFANSDKYNLDVSEVGKAAISLEKVFNKLLNDKFSLMEGNSKIQRKR